VLRVPKQLLEHLPVAAVHRSGTLTDQIKEVLQLTDLEAEQAQAALNRFLSDYYAAQQQNLRMVSPQPDDLQGRTAEETRVFELKAIGPRQTELRQTLFADLQSILDAERFGLFRNALSHWMSVDDEPMGMGSGMVILNHDRRERFYRPQPGLRWLSWSFSSPQLQSSMSMAIPFDEIPAMYRTHLEDWIALALSAPAPVATENSR
jgi:hypothetical protein